MTLVNLSPAHIHLLKASAILASRAHGFSDEQRRLLKGAAGYCATRCAARMNISTICEQPYATPVGMSLQT